MISAELKKTIRENNEAFAGIYGSDDVAAQQERYIKAIREFEKLYGEGRDISVYSAPGRTEVGGNHTDHQHGRVLAAAVNLDCIAVVSENSNNIIRIKSGGHDEDIVELSNPEPCQSEKNKAAALIRGVAARFKMLGLKANGFDAYTTSNVLKGSGLSSSAAFEVLIGTILNHLYNGGQVDAVKIAQIGQYAENVFFGKPCGLMDQTASAVGGFVTIDFKDTECPVVEKIDFNFESSGYALCIVNTGGSHADLTFEYAAIPGEMREIASFFGKNVLREVDSEEFYENLCKLRGKFSDRAVMRAIHFYDDNARVPLQAAALKSGDFEEFKRLIIESGNSSFMYLQNVFSCKDASAQGVSLALALSERVLKGTGAWRVHGGGFAGTIQAFVPKPLLETYINTIENVFGEGSCYVLSIRSAGGVKVL